MVTGPDAADRDGSPGDKGGPVPRVGAACHRGGGGASGNEGRGQAYTLEAVVAGLLLLASVGFALQMTAVTPLSASTSSQHVENQLESTAKGILAATARQDALGDAVLDWNETRVRFHGAPEVGYFTTNPPKNTFGRMLNRSFDSQRVAYNVVVVYETRGGSRKRQRMVYSGEPSDHAVSASYMVALVDDDHLVQADGATDWNHTVTDTTDPEANLYMPDAHPSSGLFNLVTVEVIAWRI